MKKRLNNLKNYIKLIIVISLFVMATGIAIEQLHNLGFKKFNVHKKEYKFYLEQHEGEHDYEPSTALEFPTRGYVLNIEKTNAECTTGELLKQNANKSVDFLARYSTVCDLYYDIRPEYKSTLIKLQELSGEWQVKSGNPNLGKVSPREYFVHGGFNTNIQTNTVNANRYLTYASDFTVDPETGKYSLVNPQIMLYSSYGDRHDLEGQYVVDPTGSTSNQLANYQNLDTIYKVTETHMIVLTYYIYTQSAYTSTAVDNSECGIWESDDNYGKTYYVRGAYNYNYVKFGNLYFRVIRINGDGSLRLMYDGTSAGAKAAINVNDYNQASNDNAYVGYMYGSLGASTYNETHLNVNSSNAKSLIDNWYQENLSGYSSYISDTLFCNNRKLKSGNGYSTNETSYDFDNNTFLFTCPQKNDRFTVNDTTVGNGALTYPVGMLTGEEAVRAGYYPNQTVYSSNYLVKNTDYYSMTPKSFMPSVPAAFLVRVNSNGTMGGYNASPNTSIGIVPVINLTAEAVQLFSGTGTASDPFEISDESSSSSGSSSSQQNPKVKTLAKLQSLNPNITVNSGTPNFANAATTDEGLYAAEDDYGTSYYWRGAATTNYIKFGDWYWRIIRINGDDSLRLFYDGSSPGANGNIGTSVYNDPNNNKAYIGYMFGSTNSSASTNEANTNLNSSTIKSFIDTWYINNIKDKQYEKYISDTLFCNDRTSYIATTAYGAVGRLDSNKQPILTCPQKNDAFTVNDTNHGNGSLTYPIGLITADEASIMGSVINSFALQSQIDYWTMSPTTFTYNQVLVYGVNGNYITEVRANLESKTKPVINISNDAIQTMTGSGTSSDPFIVH